MTSKHQSERESFRVPELPEHLQSTVLRLLQQSWEQVVEAGSLYLVGTPVGNLCDLSPRVLTILAQVDGIAAEDTRRTRMLLSALDLHRPLHSYHQHNEQQRSAWIRERLLEGETWAVVTDAGMPGISDPGRILCSVCHDAGIPIHVIPGPSALPMAAAGSGLVEQGLRFVGFLPQPNKKRRLAWQELLSQKAPLVLYEAPHRIQKTLEEMVSLGLRDCSLCICREMSKRHESFVRKTVEQWHALIQEQPDSDHFRGEMVLVLALDQASEFEKEGLAGTLAEGERFSREEAARAALKQCLQQGMRRKDAARQVAATLGLSVQAVYAMDLPQRGQESVD